MLPVLDYGQYKCMLRSSGVFCDAMQTDAAAWGTQNMVLQGFFVRAGADTSPTEGTFGYTYRRDTVATIGGPQFIATLYEAEPLALLNSNYSVRSSTVEVKLHGSLHGILLGVLVVW